MEVILGFQQDLYQIEVDLEELGHILWVLAETEFGEELEEFYHS